MKFITEMELRDRYKTEPFATYGLETDTKLTPGARQFLVDRRVTLTQERSSGGKSSNANKQKQVQRRESWCTLRLRGRLDCTASLFLVIGAELLRSGDAALSEEVLALSKCFQSVQKAEREQTAPEKIQFWGWTEEEIKGHSDALEKCVDISEFHVGLENAKELTLLNHLRASLRELEPAILETYWNEEQQVCSREELIDTVNLIINIVCMMMWECLGGQKWKR